jgi:hypothetical protein
MPCAIDDPSLCRATRRRARLGHMPMKTMRDRADERRALSLLDVVRQVRSGSLVIRPMTKAERERSAPPSPDRAPLTRGWR